ncbi:MAG: crotonase/enoyl-CoA hydratase family protein [Candidatus Schekmanbacteria bacterium]|nr:crotonase/enoyl-CoA hydratase family protein [Candidatus Schekmanbacteria bacterium]
MTVRTETRGAITTIILNRPEARNAIDPPTAEALRLAFSAFDADDRARVAVLYGAGGTFCAGADLRAIATGKVPDLTPDGAGPLGPTRMMLTKPVIAAVSGHAVAGGLELALWCDLRVAEESAVFGVFCRRFGVPLMDGGTVRLPRLIGQSRALDMILTGRGVGAAEALTFGLVNRVVANGTAREAAEELAEQLASLPQRTMLGDRQAAYEQWSLPVAAALRLEFEVGLRSLQAGEFSAGAQRFSDGSGRHGQPE